MIYKLFGRGELKRSDFVVGALAATLAVFSRLSISGSRIKIVWNPFVGGALLHELYDFCVVAVDICPCIRGVGEYSYLVGKRD